MDGKVWKALLMLSRHSPVRPMYVIVSQYRINRIGKLENNQKNQRTIKASIT